MLPKHLLLALALAGSACAGPAKDTPVAQDPALPPVKAIPDDPMDRRIVVDQGYSLLSATMRNGDRAMMAGLYAPDASLMLPDSTVRGAPAIANRLALLAQAKSMVAFYRTSQRLTVLDDSTLADSGSYVLVSRRTPTDSVMDPGTYHTRWRARSGTGNWVILEDHIVPGKGARKAGK